MHSTFTNQRRLADAIVRDILSERRPQQASATCFTCGRTFSRGGARFCSAHCREAFDAGFPAYELLNLDLYSLPKARHGFLIDCAHCRKQFDSKGLRCCSIKCEREHHRKQELDAELRNDPFRIVKRKCDECRGEIPNWRNGRRVSKVTRFCSDRCAASARRKSSVLDRDDQNPVLSPETAKKWPKNGGFSKVVSRPTLPPKASPGKSDWAPSPNIDPAAVPDIPTFLRRRAP
jgi:hypothetical protein